jgi:nicotinamidase-related amidase
VSTDGRTSRHKLSAADTTWERAKIHPARTALVVVGMVHQATPGMGLLKQLADRGVDCSYLSDRVDNTVVPNITSLIHAFLTAAATVALVQVGEITDGPRDTPQPGQEHRAVDTDQQYDVVAALDSVKGNLTLTKLGPGGFTTPDLDQHLRRAGVDTVFYTGVMSNGCVLQTMTSGFGLGYDGYLVTDATATLTEPLQAATEAAAASMAKCISAKEVFSLLTDASNLVHDG